MHVSSKERKNFSLGTQRQPAKFILPEVVDNNISGSVWIDVCTLVEVSNKQFVLTRESQLKSIVSYLNW